MKYCPLCDAEYAATHTSCTVCGVDLVPKNCAAARSMSASGKRDCSGLARRRPVAVSEVISALREAASAITFSRPTITWCLN